MAGVSIVSPKRALRHARCLSLPLALSGSCEKLQQIPLNALAPCAENLNEAVSRRRLRSDAPPPGGLTWVLPDVKTIVVSSGPARM